MADALNLLLVVIGGGRADRLSCAGYDRETTPFLDRLAREGVRFRHMITAAPRALPAHASLFTGQFAATHGATEETGFLPARHRTLAEYLKAAGYRTAGFCTNPWVSPESGLGRGFDVFVTQRYHNRLAARAVRYGRRASDALLRRRDAGARRTNRALHRWLAADERPFFAFVHYAEPRLQVPAPRPYDRLFLPRAVSAAQVRGLQQAFQETPGPPTALGRQERAILDALYDGQLRYVDARLREVAAWLETRRQWDRTLCVVTADHGESLGEHGVLGHAVGLYDTLLRVPLLLRCPARLPQGFVVEEPAQTTDVLPTILRLLALVPDAAAPPRGRALLEDGRVSSGPAYTVAERYRPHLSARQGHGAEAGGGDVRSKAIRTRREKFVWRSDEANEFYDLTADPAEAHNVIESAATRADALRRQLFDWLAHVERFEAEAPVAGEAPRRQPAAADAD